MSQKPTRTLPIPFTTLVGREDDIDVIVARLRAEGGSMLTLVGPAGVGKTRLAIAVAERMREELPDGVIFVDFSALTDAAQVIPAIVSAAGLPEDARATSQLSAYLANRSMVLLLDNFEQVLDAAPALNACLAAAPGVRALVTSQTPLRVHGEQEFVVEPLAVPPAISVRDAATFDLADLGTIPAVRLFVARAQIARPGFVLTTANLPAVSAICRYLDGVPLAIELAAARSNVLSPEALLHRLSGSLQLLSGGPRDAPGRHQALQAAIEWTYGLLSPLEALLLERLSVFSGSFSLSAAEAIAGNAPIHFKPSLYLDPDQPLPPETDLLDWSEVFELLDGLVDHSLVQRVDSAEDDPRFRLFQTIRQFAAMKLSERGDTSRTTLRHAAWFRALAESGWTENGIPMLEHDWLDRLDRDHENVRAALDYTTELDPASGSTFAASLIWFFYVRGHRMEGIRAMQRPLGKFDLATLRPMARARNDFALGNLMVLFPQTRQIGIGYLEQVLAQLRELGHEWGVGYTLMSLATLAEDEGNYRQALAYIDQALPLLVDVDDAPTLANVRFHQAVNYFGLGEFARARELGTSVATAPFEDAGINIGYAWHLLGMIELAEGNPAAAAKRFKDSLDFSLEHRLIGTATELIDAAASVAVVNGDLERAVLLFGAADRLNRETGNPITLPELDYYSEARVQAREAMPAARFDALLAEGATRSIEQGFELAHATLDVTAGDPRSKAPDSTGSVGANTLGLTNREIEVLRLVAMGSSDREIGDQLFISHGTARTHVRNILGKLGVHSRSAATGIALREGIVSATGTDSAPPIR